MSEAHDTDAVTVLYREVVSGWNDLDAARVAAGFARDGLMIGYDGSEMRGPTQIAESFAAIFKDHKPGRWVTLVQGVDAVSDDVQVLRAHSAWFMSPDRETERLADEGRAP